MDVRYEVSFQDWSTDYCYTCKHAHKSLKETIACFQSRYTRYPSCAITELTVFGGKPIDPKYIAKYEVSFQDWSTDHCYTCKHAHESIKEAVACLFRSARAAGAYQPLHHTIWAVYSDGYYRELTPLEKAQVEVASQRFIV